MYDPNPIFYADIDGEEVQLYIAQDTVFANWNCLSKVIWPKKSHQKTVAKKARNASAMTSSGQSIEGWIAGACSRAMT